MAPAPNPGGWFLFGGWQMKKGFYFSHDFNTRSDEKIKKLIQVRGMAGYGVFWSIVESLYNNANALRLDYDCIAFDLHAECDLVKSVINDFDLFIFDGDFFGSLSVERRLKEMEERSAKASNSANCRWSNANAMQTQCDSNAIKENKRKENKSNKTKIKSVFHAPELKEVIDYFIENGYTEVSAKRAFDYYSEGNWKDSEGKPVRNWKQKVRGVWFKPDNEDRQLLAAQNEQKELDQAFPKFSQWVKKNCPLLPEIDKARFIDLKQRYESDEIVKTLRWMNETGATDLDNFEQERIKQCRHEFGE